MREMPVLVPIVVLLTMAAAAVVLPDPAERRLRGRDADPDTALRLGAIRLLGIVRARAALGPASRRRRSEERMRVVRALAALAAELEAGQVPSIALQRCGGEPTVWPHARSAVTLDGDVTAALRRDAVAHPVLRHLAACWQVAADSGGGLAASVARLAESARSAEDVRVELEGQLAAPRATARLLAGLPVIGVALGVMLGAEPLAWLLGTTPGRACLVGGVLLTAVGTWWTGRIAASVERLL